MNNELCQFVFYLMDKVNNKQAYCFHCGSTDIWPTMDFGTENLYGLGEDLFKLECRHCHKQLCIKNNRGIIYIG